MFPDMFQRSLEICYNLNGRSIDDYVFLDSGIPPYIGQ